MLLTSEGERLPNGHGHSRLSTEDRRSSSHIDRNDVNPYPVAGSERAGVHSSLGVNNPPFGILLLGKKVPFTEKRLLS